MSRMQYFLESTLEDDRSAQKEKREKPDLADE